MNTNLFTHIISEHKAVFDKLLTTCEIAVNDAGSALINCLQSGGKILICGNGGSAADAQHFAAELTGRYVSERLSLPGIALTTDTSALTAIGNDYGFNRIFARQIQGLACKGDVLVLISTSGNSQNLIEAISSGREKGCYIIGLTGESGGEMNSLCDSIIKVPSKVTARIQEAHITIIHCWCHMIDNSYSD